MQYRTAKESRAANTTYHLVPAVVWNELGSGEQYLPEAFEADGFIHCTNGLDALLEVANLFYQGDPRPYEVLVLNLTAIVPDVKYDDPEQRFPHIYGPLNSSAVAGRLAVKRGSDGTFLGFSPHA